MLELSGLVAVEGGAEPQLSDIINCINIRINTLIEQSSISYTKTVKYSINAVINDDVK